MSRLSQQLAHIRTRHQQVRALNRTSDPAEKEISLKMQSDLAGARDTWVLFSTKDLE